MELGSAWAVLLHGETRTGAPPGPALFPPDSVRLNGVSPGPAKQTSARITQTRDRGLGNKAARVFQVKRSQPPTPEGKEQPQRPRSRWRGTSARRPPEEPL